MLIDLTMRTVIHPTEYLGTLVVRIGTDNHSHYGVFYGDRYTPEEGRRLIQPKLRAPDPDDGMTSFEDIGIYDFVIDRAESCAKKHQVLDYRYLVLSPGHGGHTEYPLVWLLTLHELSEGWHLSMGRPQENGFDLMLPDYQPGWIQRTEAKIFTPS